MADHMVYRCLIKVFRILPHCSEMNEIFIFEHLQSKVFKKDQVAQVNPPKFDCQDDMAGLTYLYDACVLYNSVIRYCAYLHII